MFSKNKSKNVEKIYQNIVRISRSKYFYIQLNLNDDFETRFDLIILHLFVIFYFYKLNPSKNSNLSQDLFDFAFNDIENNLREMGFGDIAVNKKMKLFIRAFYGRIAKYSESIDLYKNNNNKSLLQQTILNNLYKGKIEKKAILMELADYMIKNINYFLDNSESKNLKSNFNFKF